jgi:hypothetical protein
LGAKIFAGRLTPAIRFDCSSVPQHEEAGMNVRYRVELNQCERDRLTALLSGGKDAAHVFDLWTHRRRRNATGDVIAIRYADDTIVGFQHEHEAKAFLHDLQERMRTGA